MTTGRCPRLRPRAATDVIAREPLRPRPLFIPALALIAGIWASEQVGPSTTCTRVLLPALPLAAFAALALLPRAVVRPLLVHVLVAAVALPIGFGRHQATFIRPSRHLVHALGDEPVLTRLAGRVVTSPVERPGVKRNPFLPFEPPSRTHFVLDAEEFITVERPIPTAGRVRVAVEATDLGLRLGQRVQVTGRLFRPAGPRNPGERDWTAWYRQQGIDAGMAADGAAYIVTLPGPAHGPAQWIAALRARARSLLFEPYADLPADEATRLLDVMVLGQRSAADRELNEAFLRAGGLHFLAVSGFHVGVLAGAVWALLRYVLCRGRRTAALGMLVASVLYAVIAEPNAPILRATTLIVCAALALPTNRPLCVFNWLALAAIGILLFNPNELFRPGFQLSFVIVIGLITVVPTVYRIPFGRRAEDTPPREAQTLSQLIWLKLGRYAAGLAIVCGCAWLISLPLTMLHFGRIAPWGALGTFLLTPAVIVTIILSLVSMVLNAVAPPLAGSLGELTHWAGGGLLGMVRLAEYLPGAVVECSPPPAWLVLLTYGVVGWLLYRRKPIAPSDRQQQRRMRRQLVSKTVLLGANAGALLIIGWTGHFVLPQRGRGPGYTVHVLAVGDGSATILAAPGGRALVYDVGTSHNRDAGETTNRALRALGLRRVDTAILSHANFDHYSGLPTLLKRFTVHRWAASPYFLPRGRREGLVDHLLNLMPAEARSSSVLRAGDHLLLRRAQVEVLWPPEGLGRDWQANDRALVVRFSAAGRSVLLTGDIERAAMEALLEAHRVGRVDLKADILVAPHHGAVLRGITAAFYAAVSPETVVVPARSTRAQLPPLVAEAVGPDCRILTTGEVGAVTIRILPDGRLHTETPFAPRGE